VLKRCMEVAPGSTVRPPSVDGLSSLDDCRDASPVGVFRPATSTLIGNESTALAWSDRPVKDSDLLERDLERVQRDRHRLHRRVRLREAHRAAFTINCK